MVITQPEDLGFSSERLNRINDLTRRYVEQGHIAGALTLVARRGQVVHLECTGSQNLEKQIPMSQDAIFKLFSMTKPITTAAAMVLYERGLFQLDTPVSKFIPAVKDMQVYAGGTADDYTTVKADREMNMRDLLTHTSGLTYEFLNKTPVDELYRRHGIDVGQRTNMPKDEFINTITSLPLLFSPGSKWNYSYSTDLLGHAMEIMTGLPLDEIINKEICEPLGMVDTKFYYSERDMDRIAAVYYLVKHMDAASKEKFKGQTFANMGILDMKAPAMYFGGGGMRSTVDDYFRLLLMYMNKGRVGNRQILSPKTIEMMTSNQLPGDIRSFNANSLGSLSPNGYGYGMGVAVMLDPTKANILGSPGEFYWFGAGHNCFFCDPEEELIGMLITAVMPTIYKINQEFRVAVYQSILESNVY